jgi:hypothetical protein
MSRSAVSISLVISWICFAASEGSAYDLRTHGLITELAYARSVATHSYLSAVGLKTTTQLDVTRRTQLPELAGYDNPGTPLGWLVEGAIREDDYNTNLSFVGCASPRNPPSAIDRVRHHFYDPDTNRGMSLGLLTGLPAPEWALGELGRGPGATENQFSLIDARLYQLRSLIEAAPEERERQAALMFRSLGQVIHLLQDMAQPQHTRNDIHPACDSLLESVIPEHSFYESYIEQRARGARFRGRPTAPLQIAGYPAPSFTTARSFFTAVGQRGLADFSSHNFFTTRTNLWTLPIPCGGRTEPPCRVDAYTPLDVLHPVKTALGPIVQAKVRLFLRTMLDPVTGASIPDVAVSSRSVWDQHLQERGNLPKFSLNVLNYDSISGVLLPRAAGYAAGLLDHFFAGRLEASVQPAGEPDPTILRLVATNASDDAVDGVLLIYAEDPVTRVRQNVLTPTGSGQPLGAFPTGLVLANGRFPEILFRPPFSTEKYAVVYHGRRLGPPHVEEPVNGAIGAVMARVLGGPRAEAIVRQGERRLLRSVSGTFGLPVSTDGLELLQWSDLDNHFVGASTTPLAAGGFAPEQVKLFRLSRPTGSVDVPLVPDADPALVLATLLKTVPFPYGLDLGTTVDYTQRVRVRQPVVTYDRAQTFHWQEDGQGYHLVADSAGPPSLQIPVDETVTFAQRFPIVLDAEHLLGASAATPRPYWWRVVEIGHDLRDRLLAVVEVQLSRPIDPDRNVLLKGRSRDCASLEPRGVFEVNATFPAGGLIALIDLERGEVLGSTGTSLFEPVSTELAAVSPFLEVRVVSTLIGGPDAGTQTQCHADAFRNEDQEFPTEVAGALTLPPTGITEFTVPGLYRSDVEAVAGTPVQITPITGDFQLVYAIDNGVNKAVQLQTSSTFLSGYLTLIREGLRIRPASPSATELVLRFDRPEGIGEVRSVLVRWDPASTSATRVAGPDELESGRYQLKNASADAALLVMEDVFTGDSQTVLVDFDTRAVTAFTGDISDEFVLLRGGLYSVTDTRFHTRDTLAETALPLPLAPGPVAEPSLGAYHLIVRE